MNIEGVKIIDLKANPDARGTYTEILHDDWEGIPPLKQWSVVHSKPGTIRGMRIHIKHYDYTCVCHGSALYVLKDLRQGSPTYMANQYVELKGNKLQTILTPPGVAHGFYFYEDTIFVVGITHHYDPEDELAFHFQDKEAGIKWPKDTYIVSARDSGAPPMQGVLSRMPEWNKPPSK